MNSFQIGNNRVIAIRETDFKKLIELARLGEEVWKENALPDCCRKCMYKNCSSADCSACEHCGAKPW